jgi:protoporphyrinogen oxidase
MQISKDTKATSVAIIGGGIMGVVLAYRLSQHGFDVTIYERSQDIGGLASYIPYDGVRIDRFYHTILSSDMSMQTLIEESGVKDRLHFTATKQGFYDNGKIYPFSTPVDLIRYPPLTIFQRIRLGLQIIYAQFESDWQKIDQIPVERWLVKVSGRSVYEKVWKPLLRAKFDTISEHVPATYIWSRLKRMMGTRQGVTSKEMMCYLENGYYTLIEALAAKCKDQGVTIHLNTAIQKVALENGQAVGIHVEDGQFVKHDIIISTLPSPLLGSLIPDAPQAFQDQLKQQEYLGVLCPLFILKKSLIPYYVLNITDETIPFTAVVETTNLIDPVHVKGHHLIYLPKYLAPGNEMATWPDKKVKTEWLHYLKKMFPDFEETWITDVIVQRARYVEPIRPMDTLHQIPVIKTPIPGMYMGNTVMIYPALGNGEAVTSFANKIVAQILHDVGRVVGSDGTGG